MMEISAPMPGFGVRFLGVQKAQFLLYWGVPYKDFHIESESARFTTQRRYEVLDGQMGRYVLSEGLSNMMHYIHYVSSYPASELKKKNKNSKREFKGG